MAASAVANLTVALHADTKNLLAGLRTAQKAVSDFVGTGGLGSGSARRSGGSSSGSTLPGSVAAERALIRQQRLQQEHQRVQQAAERLLVGDERLHLQKRRLHEQGARLDDQIAKRQKGPSFLGSVGGAAGFFARAGANALGTVAGNLATGGLDMVAGLIGSATSAAGGAVFGINASLEQSDLAFKTMLGSQAAAAAFTQQLAAFAAENPVFKLEGVTTAAQQLMGVKIAAQDIVPLLKDIGDNSAAMGLGSSGIDRITRAMFQMKAIGVVQMGEVNQLSETGVPMIEALADYLGIKGGAPADPKKLREAQDRLADLRRQFTRNELAIGGERAGANDATVQGHRDTRARLAREVQEAQSDLEQLQAGPSGNAQQAVRKMIENGQISADQGIAAYQAFVRKRFPNMAQEAANTWDGSWDSIKETLSLGVSKAFKSVFTTTRGLAVQFNTFLQSPGFAAFVDRINRKVTDLIGPFSNLGTLIGNLSRDNGLAPLQATLVGLELTIGQAFGPGAAGVFHGLVDGIAKGFGLIKTGAQWLLDNGSKVFGWIGDKLPGLVESIAGNIGTLVQSVPGWLAQIGTFKDSLVAGFQLMVADIKRTVGQLIIDLADAGIPYFSDKLKPAADRLRDELGTRLPDGTTLVRPGPPGAAPGVVGPASGLPTYSSANPGTPLTQHINAPMIVIQNLDASNPPDLDALFTQLAQRARVALANASRDGAPPNTLTP